MEENQTSRRTSGWRYVAIGVLTFIFTASLFMAGLVLGGGASLVDRILSGLGVVPAPAPAATLVSGDAIVQQIRQISRLETTTYAIERVIEVRQSDTNWPDWLRGDRLLLIANGTVIAGIDMEQLQSSDVIVSADGKTVTITLPPAQIFNLGSILNNAKTRVYDRQQGLLAPPNENLETEARPGRGGSASRGRLRRGRTRARHRRRPRCCGSDAGALRNGSSGPVSPGAVLPDPIRPPGGSSLCVFSAFGAAAGNARNSLLTR